MFRDEIKNYGLEIFVSNIFTDIQGFIFIMLSAFIAIKITSKEPDIFWIIITALAVRIFVLLIGHYIIHLPDSTADALGHEWLAWNIGKNGLIYTIVNFKGPGEEFYSWLMAIPYSLFGRNILILQSIGILFGVLSVYLTYLLSKKIWNKKIAKKVCWITALFPSLILYSVVVLKEVFCSFFILVAFIGVVNWVKFKRYHYALMAYLGFVAAGFFHGPLFLGTFVFSIFFFSSVLKNSLKSLNRNRINLIDFSIMIFLICSILVYLSGEIYLPYLGSFEATSNLDNLINAISNRTRGIASYPDWLIVENFLDLTYKSFFRMFYLLFYPFPWSIKDPIHLVGAFDSLIYFILFLILTLNFKNIWKHEPTRLVFLILIFYFLIYGIGVSNFGAGIRHRSKFIIELLILASPLIPHLIFYKLKKEKKF
ncbi:hypothetical protein N9M93_04260 [Candidatus Pelagibacter bacterium]|nr:hypothetical protein [Candidatus Pelagibacter bacterium]